MRGFLFLLLLGLAGYWLWRQGWIHSVADIPGAIVKGVNWLGAKFLNFVQALFGGLAHGIQGTLGKH